MKTIIDRLKEPSSWAALAALSGSFGLQIPNELAQQGSLALAGVAGIVGFFLKEKKR